MEQKDKPKQTNWLTIAVVTTILGGVVQVIVNHFDSITAFLGGSLTHVHLSVGVAGVLNTISALVTIGGTIASPFIYRYMKHTREMEAALKQIRKIAEKYPDIPVEPISVQPLPSRAEVWRLLEEEGKTTVSIKEVSEKSKS